MGLAMTLTPQTPTPVVNDPAIMAAPTRTQP